MQVLTMVAEICSILGFLVSIFVASKVIRVTKSFNENQGEFQYGDGKKNIVKDHSILVEENGTATINVGEVDEPPILKQKRYNVSMVNIDFYKEGIEGETFKRVNSQQTDTIVIHADFTHTVSVPEVSRWIGYSIKSLPMRDWRSFVKESYALEFSYIATGNIDSIWLELTNFALGKKLYREPVKLNNASGKFVLGLEQFQGTVEDWKSVDEICFVAFPEECAGQYGTICITNFIISQWDSQ